MPKNRFIKKAFNNPSFSINLRKFAVFFIITFHFSIFPYASPRLLLRPHTSERLLHAAGKVELLEEGDAAPVAGGAGDQVSGEHGPGVRPAHDAHPASLGVTTEGAQHQPQGPSAGAASGLGTSGVCGLGNGDIARLPRVLGSRHRVLVLHLQLRHNVVKNWIILPVWGVGGLPSPYVIVVQSSHRFHFWALDLESVVEGLDGSWCVASPQS